MFITKLLSGILLIASSFNALAFSVTEEQGVLDSASLFGIDPCLIQAVLTREGGGVGEKVYHQNGSIDVGRAQVNQGGEWEKHFNEMGITSLSLKDNPALPGLIVGYILNKELPRSGGDIVKAVSAYHRGNGNKDSIRGYQYAQGVFRHYLRLLDSKQCLSL